MQRPLVEPWPVWYNKWGHHPSPWAEGVFRCQRWLRWGSFPWHSAASVCSCCAGGWCEAVGVFWGSGDKLHLLNFRWDRFTSPS